VHEGDILRLNLNSKILTCQILIIPKGNVSISEASSLYKITSEENVD
jgi:ribosomal 50S subunit-recycling heat shock protein